jgi:excinuclease ABC subunit A
MLLAPVVKDRKGEHVQAVRELRAQGFVRARINGEVVELDEPADLDLRKKAHHRGGGRPLQGARGPRLRLAESFETALRWATAWRGWPSWTNRSASRAAVFRQVRLPGLRLQLASWNRGCSPSTTPPGACPAATAWA